MEKTVKSHKYIIMGDPIPLARARHTSNRVYDAQKHLKFSWGLQLQDQHKDKSLFTGPLCLDVDFYINLPSKISLGKKSFFLLKPHTTRPDLSNLIKFVEDAATGILFNNDCIIAEIRSRKLYDKQPRTEFTITEIK